MSSANPAPPRSGLLLTRVSVGLLLLLGTFLILRSFIVPILWASVVVFMTWGLYERACRMSGRPQLTAGLFTLSVLLLFGIPSLWVLISLAEQTAGLVRAAQGWISAGAPLPGWLMDIGWLGPRIEELRSQALQGTGELGPHLVRLGRGLSEQLIGVARGAVQSALSFLITLVTAFVLYVNGRNVVEGARRLMLHIFPDRPPDFLDHVGSVVRAVVIGIVGTAVIQGAVQGVGLAIFGVPSPVALGALTVVLSFVPGGPVLVWGGAAAWLFATGHTGAAIGLAIWGALVVGSIDNFLRPALIRRSGSVDIPFLLILFGVLGGLGAFGLLGLLIGPVVLSVAFTLLTEIPQGSARAAPSPQS